MKDNQKGFIDSDAVATMLAMFVLFGIVIGWGLSVGIPWLWAVVKPFIHTATGA